MNNHPQVRPAWSQHHAFNDPSRVGRMGSALRRNPVKVPPYPLQTPVSFSFLFLFCFLRWLDWLFGMLVW